MTSFLIDLGKRLLRTETLVAVAALYLVATGKVQTMQEGIALATTALSYIGGRSWVKAKNG